MTKKKAKKVTKKKPKNQVSKPTEEPQFPKQPTGLL